MSGAIFSPFLKREQPAEIVKEEFPMKKFAALLLALAMILAVVPMASAEQEPIIVRWGTHWVNGQDPNFIDETTGTYAMTDEADRQLRLAAEAAVLEKHNVKITFFMAGHFMRKFPEAVKKIQEIITQGNIIYVVAEGYATSQDNYVGENAENVGLERNKTLAYNRAFTVVNWLKGNDKLKNVPAGAYSVNALVNPIKTVKDESVLNLTPKLCRSVKVRIHYVINR